MNRTGKDLQLHVSSGAIRKVQKQVTTNGDMVIHGRFLQVRFSDAIIKTSRSTDWVIDFGGNVTEICARECCDAPIKTHVGDLHLTRHAVERFSQRMSIPSLDRAWRRLTKLLNNSDWTCKKPSEPLRDGKAQRTTETWSVKKGESHPVDIVIVRSAKASRIVTVIA